MYKHPPFSYEELNLYDSIQIPATVKVKNTGLVRFFRKYLLQKAMAVFRWTIPETWDRDYFLNNIYVSGFIAIIKTDAFGVIPQHCTLSGKNVFYRPSTVIINNPINNNSISGEYKIDVDCSLIKLQPNYSGIMDIVNYYADMLALTSSAMGVNILNSHLSYAFTAANKAGAESFKKGFDEISSGEPIVIFDKTLFGTDGSPQWQPFQNNLSNNYIADKLLSEIKMIEYEFEKHVGIPSVNTDKKERLISDEVNGNNVGVALSGEIWLESLQDGIKKTIELFGIHPTNFSVDWRVYPKISDYYLEVEENIL